MSDAYQTGHDVEGTARRTRIALVADERGTLRGLAMRLAVEPGVEVVCAELAQDLDPLPAWRPSPDVVLVDRADGSLGGLRRHLDAVFPDTPVVVLALHDDPRARATALGAGARGFVSKHDPDDALLTTLQTIHQRRDGGTP